MHNHLPFGVWVAFIIHLFYRYAAAYISLHHPCHSRTYFHVEIVWIQFIIDEFHACAIAACAVLNNGLLFRKSMLTIVDFNRLMFYLDGTVRIKRRLRNGFQTAAGWSGRRYRSGVGRWRIVVGYLRTRWSRRTAVVGAREIADDVDQRLGTVGFDGGGRSSAEVACR